MRNALRNLVPLLSVAFVVAGVVLSARSFHHDDHWEFSSLRAHYTVRSYRGFVVVMGPPPQVNGPLEAKAWDALKRLRNEQVTFVVRRGIFRGDDATIEMRPVPGSAAEELAQLPESSTDAALMRGLDGRGKFAAASWLLQTKRIWVVDLAGNMKVTADKFADLRVPGYVLSIPKESLVVPKWGEAPEPIIIRFDGSNAAKVDPSELDAIRSSWHRRWDVEVFRIRYVWLVMAALVFPLLRARQVWIESARRRRGRCAVCGYDLRSSPARCPECGAAPLGAG